ncbi:MAG: TraB/GumN family protein [Candidatus Diapherotrites archaeon]|nr:TraB/GumN family protein [Candidatus Diapherotrites archaeon]
MTVHRVLMGEKEILLIGTAHVSQASIELVKNTITLEKPDIVGVELDEQRYAQLLQGTKWNELNVRQVIQTGQTYLLLLNILLANMQRRVGEQVGVKPGEEMLEAVRAAQEHKTAVALLDRNIGITFKRAMKKIGFIEKLRLAGALLEGFTAKENLPITPEKVEELKEEDTLNALLKEMGQKMPGLKEVLVDERDSYIAEKIKSMQGKKVLAVLGAGHVEGVKRKLHEHANLKALETIPSGTPWGKIIQHATPLIFIVLIAGLFFTKGLDVSLNLLGFWFLAHGIFSALGAGLARSHPITIIVAFLASPFTALHPAIAAGWVAAYVEYRFNTPKVKDFSNLSQLNTYKDFSNNSVTHLLLVTAYTNIGSTIATLIAVPYVIALFG